MVNVKFSVLHIQLHSTVAYPTEGLAVNVIYYITFLHPHQTDYCILVLQ